MATTDPGSDFTGFVEASADRLRRTALLLTGDVHRADDLVQATYTQAFVKWRSVRRAGNPVAYTRATMTNLFLSEKRLKRSSELSVDPTAGSPVDAESIGRDAVVDADPTDRLDLLAALRTLPPLDRAVVVLRYWEDRSVPETAHELDLTEYAVRSRASRALARLRPLLDPALASRHDAQETR